MHPRATDVRWRSEHCWIYDHPRAGTVYSHGFLFPSEVTRIRDEITKGLTPGQLHLLPSTSTTISGSIRSGDYTSAADADPSLTHSTVSRFGKHYRPPAANLTTEQEVEALVEGSALSKLRDETVGGATGEATQREVESAWRRRESRRMRTLGISAAAAASMLEVPEDSGAVGGTVVVHFIKRNEWFLETALAFLEDEPDPPPYEGDDELGWNDDVPSKPGKSGGNRVETDLNGKTPLDLSNLDPQPEVVKPAPKKGPPRIETDFNGKRPIDISHLDDVEIDESPVENGDLTSETLEEPETPPTTLTETVPTTPETALPITDITSPEDLPSQDNTPPPTDENPLVFNASHADTDLVPSDATTASREPSLAKVPPMDDPIEP